MAPNLPSTTSVFTTYTSMITYLMILKTMFNEVQNVLRQILPETLFGKITSYIRQIFHIDLSEDTLTIIIDQYSYGHTPNQLYEASQTFLRPKIGHWNKRLKATKSPRDTDLSISIAKGEEIRDTFEGISLKWVQLVSTLDHKQKLGRRDEQKSMELTFLKQHKEKVLKEYLPFVLKTAQMMQEDNKVVKLYKLEYHCDEDSSINLHHPSTFDTIAMEPEVKKALIDDLDRFMRRKEFYRRVGKVWKRGYLLYGPSGTGKSSLIAAIANYLKFDIYDFDLSKFQYTLDFRKLLVSTANRSIIVIEDIDCNTENALRNRQQSFGGDLFGSSEGSRNERQSHLLANLLNFVDGLWSSCGDERIIIFTTNYKERLDPALLRPGRMDMHIHLSYLSFAGFKILASNYLNVSSHPLFDRIEELIAEVKITPASVAEELMKSDDVDDVLQGFVEVLVQKKEETEAQKM